MDSNHQFTCLAYIPIRMDEPVPSKRSRVLNAFGSPGMTKGQRRDLMDAIMALGCSFRVDVHHPLYNGKHARLTKWVCTAYL